MGDNGNLIYLTPCILLSFKGEGKINKRRAKPLLNTPNS